MLARKSNRWIETLQNVVTDYNAQPRPGTHIPRKDIDKDNYMKMLSQLWRTVDPDSVISMRVFDNIPDEIGDVIFKFKVGDKVTLSHESVIGGTPYGIDNEQRTKTNTFKKKSITGNWFMKRVFTVKRRLLRSTSQFHMTPCYKISSSVGGVCVCLL